MNGHLKGQLDAYVDGELTQAARLQVERHLSTCEDCRALVQKRRALTSLLHQLPPAETLKSETRFVAEVGLQLPPVSAQNSTHLKWTALLWALAPVGLLLGIVFLRTVLLLSAFVDIVPGVSEALFQSASTVAGIPFLPEPMSGMLALATPIDALGWDWLAGWAAMGMMGFLYVVWLIAWGARTWGESLRLQ